MSIFGISPFLSFTKGGSRMSVVEAVAVLRDTIQEAARLNDEQEHARARVILQSARIQAAEAEAEDGEDVSELFYLARQAMEEEERQFRRQLRLEEYLCR